MVVVNYSSASSRKFILPDAYSFCSIFTLVIFATFYDGNIIFGRHFIYTMCMDVIALISAVGYIVVSKFTRLFASIMLTNALLF